MRIFLLVIAILTLSASTFYIFYKKKISGVSSELKITNIRIPKTIINIGNRAVNSPAIGRFVVYNTGSNDLYIENVEPECHCTIGEFTNSPVKPNDSTIILLRYDSTRVGVFQSTAKLLTNSNQPILLLVLRGNMIDSSSLH